MNLQEQINKIADIVISYAEGDADKLQKWSNHVMAVRKAHGALNKELILLDLVFILVRLFLHADVGVNDVLIERLRLLVAAVEFCDVLGSCFHQLHLPDPFPCIPRRGLPFPGHSCRPVPGTL